MWDLAPVILVCFQDQFDTRLMIDQAIGSEANRLVLEGFIADFLDIFSGDNPAGARRGRAVERHKIRPGLMQAKAHVMGVDNLHGLYPFFQVPGTSTRVALEAELHILGSEGVAIV